MLTPDTIIDRRYRILRPIGKGGMGAVYKVTDERLGRTLALKQMTVTGEKFAQAFKQEARLLARLSHPGLPQVYDHFSDPQGQFLVMEYIPGPDLREALTVHQKPFVVEEVLRLADQLLDVLEYLHTQPEPVIHRDIKPANIKVPNGQVKLLDFGLTKGSADYVSRIRMSSLTGYTLTFAPPEQIRGKPTGTREPPIETSDRKRTITG
jgi:serine/threonine protein kinase